MAQRDETTLTEIIVAAINPVLVMVLVGSLAYFVLEVCYAGAYGDNLRWTLFFFVLAAVLIARISMLGETSGRVGCYAPLLGLAVWLTMQKYVDYPPDSPAAGLRGLINLGLIALIWWCAHRLTWDCTYQAEEADRGGEGLLQAAGLEDSAQPPAAAADPADEEPGKPLTWQQRYRRYQEERKRKRTHGTWVIWFSLAALPLFGLGQSLIPVEAVERRRYVFWLMTLYTGSGLGLLLTTSFLGLRRYLRQRKLEMPAGLTAVWLGMGVSLIGVLLVLGAFLPRPHAEYPLINFKPLGSQDRDASQFAQRGQTPGKNQGRPGGENKEEQDKDSGKEGQQKGGQADQEKDKEKDGLGDQEKGQQKGEQGNQEKDKDGKEQARESKDSQRSGDREGGQKGQSPPGSQQSPGRQFAPPPVVSQLAGLLKWLVFAIVALVVLFVLLRSGLSFLAHSFDWARRWLEGLHNLFARLFGSKENATGEESESEDARLEERPFTSFANPFHDGRASRMPVKELLCYTFAALQAWARDRGFPRQEDETPLEFAARLGDEAPALEVAVRRLTNLYVRAVYASQELPASCGEEIEEFWERLERAGERQTSSV